MADPSYIVDGVLTDGEAWVAVDSTTIVGSSTTEVTFTSTDDGQVGDFSQYMDLVVVAYAQAINAATGINNLRFRLNNDTTTANYPHQRIEGNGSSVSASASTGPIFAYMTVSGVPNVFVAAVGTFFDINSGKYKSLLSQYAIDKDGSGEVGMLGVTWKDQAAITEIDFYEPNGYAFTAGSRFDLFGVLPRMVA